MKPFSFAVSARRKPEQLPIQAWLAQQGVGPEVVDSVFGFRESTRLYGGRPFFAHGTELSEADYAWMMEQGIGYRIPIQNLLLTREDYEKARAFLEKYHRPGNSLIVAKDAIVPWLREDFPQYDIECSVIRRVDTMSKLHKALALYDMVVPDPYAFNHSMDLAAIPEEYKPRMRLFLEMGCLYDCPSRICYTGISAVNKGVEAPARCSAQEGVPRLEVSVGERKGRFTYFNREQYLAMGYTHFKLLSALNW